jgi:hypothetical protein
VHDFEPGIEPSGLFWTIPMPRSAFTARPGLGRARYRRHHLALPDYHDFGNAISPDPASTPGHVSFDVHWMGGGARTRVRDAVFGFAGDFVQGDMHIDFTVADDGAGTTYASHSDGQVTVSSGVGYERNGMFFHESEDEHGHRRGARRRPVRGSRWSALR